MVKGVRVYHNPVAYLHSFESGSGNIEGQFLASKLVAIVKDTTDFEEAWEKTNSIHSLWCGEDKDPSVVVYNGESHRSTMVGDFMISVDFALPDGEKFSNLFLVDSVGFKDVGKCP